MRMIKDFLSGKRAKIIAISSAVVVLLAVIAVIIVLVLVNLNQPVSKVILKVVGGSKTAIEGDENSDDYGILPDVILNGESVSTISGAPIGAIGLEIDTDRNAQSCSIELSYDFVEDVEIPDNPLGYDEEVTSPDVPEQKPVDIFIATEVEGSGTQFTTNVSLGNSDMARTGGSFVRKARATCDGVHSNAVQISMSVAIPTLFKEIDAADYNYAPYVEGLATYDFGVLRLGDSVPVREFEVKTAPGIYDNFRIENIRYTPNGDLSDFTFEEGTTRADEDSLLRTAANVKVMQYPTFKIAPNLADPSALTPGEHSQEVVATITFNDGHFIKARFIAKYQI